MFRGKETKRRRNSARIALVTKARAPASDRGIDSFANAAHPSLRDGRRSSVGRGGAVIPFSRVPRWRCAARSSRWDGRRTMRTPLARCGADFQESGEDARLSVQSQRADVRFVDPLGDLLFHGALDVVSAVRLRLEHHRGGFEVGSCRCRRRAYTASSRAAPRPPWPSARSHRARPACRACGRRDRSWRGWPARRRT